MGLLEVKACIVPDQPTIEDFQSLAVYARDRVNPIMFIYALSVAILHRRDTRNVPVPSLVEVFPEKYMDSAIFSQAREESNVIKDEGSRVSKFFFFSYKSQMGERFSPFDEVLGLGAIFSQTRKVV